VIKLALRSKKSFEIARNSALKRSQKEKALYLYMTNGDDKHYILKMPEDLTIIRTLDGRKLRLQDVVTPKKEETKKKKKVKHASKK
jgi:hypothetical protein